MDKKSGFTQSPEVTKALTKAAKSPDVMKLLRMFEGLSEIQQMAFVFALPPVFIAMHPGMESTFDFVGDSFRAEVAAAVKRIPKKRGKPERDAIILRLAAEGLSDAQIGWHDDVIAANDGQRMTRQAVQNVRLRRGVRKKH